MCKRFDEHGQSDYTVSDFVSGMCAMVMPKRTSAELSDKVTQLSSSFGARGGLDTWTDRSASVRGKRTRTRAIIRQGACVQIAGS